MQYKQEFQKRVADYLSWRIRRAFDTQTAPDGSPWKPLAPATRKRKGHGRILHDSGRSRRSIYAKNTPDGGVEAGVATPYARFHQNTRPFLPLSPQGTLLPQDRREIIKIAQTVIKSGLVTLWKQTWKENSC